MGESGREGSGREGGREKRERLGERKGEGGEREGGRERLRGRIRRKRQREVGESLQTNTVDLKYVDKYCSKSLEMMLASSKLTITFKINKISSSHDSSARKK